VKQLVKSKNGEKDPGISFIAMGQLAGEKIDNPMQHRI